MYSPHVAYSLMNGQGEFSCLCCLLFYNLSPLPDYELCNGCEYFTPTSYVVKWCSGRTYWMNHETMFFERRINHHQIETLADIQESTSIWSQSCGRNIELWGVGVGVHSGNWDSNSVTSGYVQTSGRHLSAFSYSAHSKKGCWPHFSNFFFFGFVFSSQLFITIREK